MKKYLIVLAVILVIAIVSFYPAVPVETGEIEILAEGLEIPWSLDFLPDRLIFTERTGGLKVIQEGEVIKVSSIPVETQSESGLHGVAVDPDFAENSFIYIYYTYKDQGVFNRVSRLKEISRNNFGEELVLVDKIPAARIHDGGAVAFGPDGFLYISTGDAGQSSNAQDTGSLAGKILRIRKDDPGSQIIFSYGHRNPQGLVWDESGRLFEAEHGNVGNDEVNIIVQGGNYGWPEHECTSGEHPPIKCFNPTLAPSGIAYYDKALYVAGLRGAQIRKLTLEGSQVVDDETILSTMGRMRALKARDGWLYFSTSNRDGRGIPRPGDDKIGRIKI